MELKDFIKTAVSDITSAVSELQSEIKNGSIINPELNYEIPSLNTIVSDNKHRLLEFISFDVSVSVSESNGKDKKGNLAIRVVSAEIGKNIEKSSEASSRISFRIPVCFSFPPVNYPKSSNS